MTTSSNKQQLSNLRDGFQKLADNVSRDVVDKTNSYLELTINIAETLNAANLSSFELKDDKDFVYDQLTTEARELKLNLDKYPYATVESSARVQLPDRSLYEILTSESADTDGNEFEKYQAIFSTVQDINTNLDNTLKLLNTNLKTFLLKFQITHLNEYGVLRMNNTSSTNFLKTQAQIDSENFNVQGNYLNVYLSCVNVASCINNTNYTTNKASHVSKLPAGQYHDFWTKLSPSMAKTILSNFLMPKKSEIQIQCSSLVENLKMVFGFEEFIDNMRPHTISPAPSSSSSATAASNKFMFYMYENISKDDVLTEFSDLCDNISKFVYVDDIDNFTIEDNLTLPASEFNEFFGIAASGGSGAAFSSSSSDDESAVDMPSESFIQHPASRDKLNKHAASHVSVILFGRTPEEQLEFDKKTKRLLAEYAHNVWKLFSPFFLLVDGGTNGRSLSLFSSNYNVFSDITPETKTFSNFVSKIDTNIKMYSILQLVFDQKMVDYFDENLLSDLFQDMTKTVVICGKSLSLLDTVSDRNMPLDISNLKEYMQDNSDLLFPFNLSIREAPILSAYYATVLNRPDFKLPGLAMSWIQDPLLLSTHISCFMMFLYFRFLEFLLSVGTKNDEIMSTFTNSDTFETIVVIDISAHAHRDNMNDEVKMINGQTRKKDRIKNIYLLAYKYLTGNSTVHEGDDNANTSAFRIDLISTVLCKILDFLYRTMKISSECFNKLSQNSNTMFDEEFFNALQESCIGTKISSIDKFEAYVVDIVYAMQTRIQSLTPYIFGRLEYSHESNMLIIAPDFIYAVANILNGKIKLCDAITQSPNFLNLTRNILIVMFKAYLAHFDLTAADDDTPTAMDIPDNLRLNTTTSNTFIGTGNDDYHGQYYFPGGSKRSKKLDTIYENCEIPPTSNNLYSFVPELNNYFLYYRNLSNRLGIEFSKFDLEKFQACPKFDQPGFSFELPESYIKEQFAHTVVDGDEAAHKKKRLLNNYFDFIIKIDESNKKIDLFNDSLSRIGNLLEIILSDTKTMTFFYLLENIALQHFYWRPNFYIYNNLDTIMNVSTTAPPQSVNLDHLKPIVDGLYVDLTKLQSELETNANVISFFESKEYLKTLRMYILKRFVNINTSKYMSFFKPIMISKKCPNFYLGILIIFLWHCMSKKTELFFFV